MQTFIDDLSKTFWKSFDFWWNWREKINFSCETRLVLKSFKNSKIELYSFSFFATLIRKSKQCWKSTRRIEWLMKCFRSTMTMKFYIRWFFIIKVSISSKSIITFTIRNYWSSFVASNIDVLNSLTRNFSFKFSSIIKYWRFSWKTNNWLVVKLNI